MSDQNPTDPWATVIPIVGFIESPLGSYYDADEVDAARAAVDAARADDAKTIAELRARITYLEDYMTDHARERTYE